ncbi:MAG: MFS transporter [Bacteroidia bacterium]|nr:MFS transporter [Bacteroidia bacterium]MDW8235738.1 MFS transporter [Bacteroidia bacterium]MDW8417616.1 MFS transporter [Bacteroidia bacterium]
MNRKVWLAVLAATLGYFVDIYDLILFSVLREVSLKDLGFSAEERLRYGVWLIDLQMLGMLIGGLLWGILGDKKGRLSVLFGSILTYSLANILNSFVQGLWDYALWRFVAGIGLAGELGAGITLVAELMPAEKRGWGTTIIATFGILGAVVASLIGDAFPWRTAYLIGGVMGIALLLLRLGVGESSLFEKMQADTQLPRGNLLQILRPKERFLRYLYAILAGVPIWYVIGILITFAPDLFRTIGLEGVKAGKAVMYAYIGLSIGDLIAGVFSQLVGSRRAPIFLWIFISGSLSVLYNTLSLPTPENVYFMAVLLGVFSGYWAVLVTTAAEQFGTNLRATVATSVPNWIRGSLVVSTLIWRGLDIFFSLRTSALLTGIFLYGVALWACMQLRETFGVSLDFVEEK